MSSEGKGGGLPVGVWLRGTEHTPARTQHCTTQPSLLGDPTFRINPHTPTSGAVRVRRDGQRDGQRDGHEERRGRGTRARVIVRTCARASMRADEGAGGVGGKGEDEGGQSSVVDGGRGRIEGGGGQRQC